MAIAERGAAESAQRIATALETAGLHYAIGGALALAIAGVPRGTADVDVNVFVPDEHIPKVIGVLSSLGIEINEAEARKHPFEQEVVLRTFHKDGSVGDW